MSEDSPLARRTGRRALGVAFVILVVFAVVSMGESEQFPDTLWVRVLPFPSAEDWDDMRRGPDGDPYRGGRWDGRWDDGNLIEERPSLLDRARRFAGLPGTVKRPRRCFEPTGVEREAGGATWAEFRWNGR